MKSRIYTSMILVVLLGSCSLFKDSVNKDMILATAHSLTERTLSQLFNGDVDLSRDSVNITAKVPAEKLRKVLGKKAYGFLTYSGSISFETEKLKLKLYWLRLYNDSTKRNINLRYERKQPSN